MARKAPFEVLIWCAALASSEAYAGTEPLYAPSPAWVTVSQLPEALKSSADAGPKFEWQERFENGQVWNYSDIAMRMSSAAMLNQSANIALPWFPDKGDLIIHEVSIVRDGKTIDLLAHGQKFKVLQREQLLEQLQLTGILSGTFVAEGLQIGDILRLRASVTVKDAALGKRIQWALPLLAQPLKPSSSSISLSWPSSEALAWKTAPADIKPQVVSKDGWTNLSLSLPIPKQPEMPQDAPQRFRINPVIMVSGFSDWADVSKAFAQYYIPPAVTPGSDLALEIDRIRKASNDPLTQTALALRSVQDKVRYLALGMNGGNYIPQPPARTWQVRFGDCKAKTLLLMTILKELGISSEAVLANPIADDLVPGQLPAPQAFNHVFVRAHVGERTLWLDGTRAWTRKADMGDPVFRNVLSINASGSNLEQVALTPPIRPSIEALIDADETASVDLPMPADLTLIFRRDVAAEISGGINAMSQDQKTEVLRGVLTSQFGDGQFEDIQSQEDLEDGSFSIKGKGLLTTAWKTEDSLRKRDVSRGSEMMKFAPDRTKAAWSAIPAKSAGPDKIRYGLRIRLPEGGRGISSTGDLDFTGKVAGVDLIRRGSIEKGLFLLDEIYSMSGEEIAPAKIALERDQATRMIGRVPKIIAPADAIRRWDLNQQGAGKGTQIAAIEALLAKAIASADKDDTSGLSSRANFLAGLGRRKEALADLDRIVAIEPTLEYFLARALLKTELGDLVGALADSEAAHKLDQSSSAAIGAVALGNARLGKLAVGVALYDERIELGGEAASELKADKAALLGEFGDPEAGIAILDDLLLKKPGNPSYLNGRCWIRGTRQVGLDIALKDCTKAIELSNDPAYIFDSRAVVWLRLGKFEEALQDIDAALAQRPDLGPSRLVRGIILNRLGRKAEADAELRTAAILAPAAIRSHAALGLKP